MTEIKPNEVYTTEETRDFLKISDSTIKRLLKRGIIRANKVGGRYRILGKEILRTVSPRTEIRVVGVYQKIKGRVRNTIKRW